MLGPFFDRDNRPISGLRLDELFRTSGYNDVAKQAFPEIRVVVRARWMGFDRDKSNDPPKIFTLQVFCGVLDAYPETHYSTEAGILAAFDSLVERFTEQVEAVKAGTPLQIMDGML